MPVPEVIRESFVGQLVYRFSGRRYFRYAEDDPNFELPEQYARLINRGSDDVLNSETRSNSDAGTLADPGQTKKSALQSEEKAKATVEVTERRDSEPRSEAETAIETHSRDDEVTELTTAGVLDPEKGKYKELQRREAEEESRDPFIVDWYSPTDPENPRNVSTISPITCMQRSRVGVVVIPEEMLRDIRYLSSYFQHIHRFRHLRAWNCRPFSTVPCLASRSFSGYHIVRRGLRHWTHVPVTAFRDTAAGTYVRIHDIPHHLCRRASADRP